MLEIDLQKLSGEKRGEVLLILEKHPDLRPWLEKIVAWKRKALKNGDPQTLKDAVRLEERLLTNALKKIAENLNPSV